MRHPRFDREAKTEIIARVGPDPRADGGCRTVLISPRCVTIRRRLRGMKMHLSVPVVNYFGVAIARGQRRDRPLYRVSLAHQDPELCVILQEARGRSSLANAQRYWAAFFAVPALTAPPARSLARLIAARPAMQTPADPSMIIPTVSPPTTAQRRRRRRRRRKGLLNRPPSIFRGEREIICYD
nr:hypothetical protein [Methylocella tundrae]